MNKKVILLALPLRLSTTTFIFAQNAAPGQGAPPEGARPRPPGPAIVAALDVNKEGKLDAPEIADATRLLLTLDKNGDGALTPDEFMGARGPGQGGERGEGGRPGGPGGAGPRPNAPQGGGR